jgi:large subunit ribosomal protein L3
MTLGLLGKKLGMTRIYDDKGSIVPVTVIQAGPCPILQIKNRETDGYCAVQLGFDPKPASRVNKPMNGHFQRAGSGPLRLVREFRTEELEGFKPGQTLDLSLFNVGERVDVAGISKGRGFAGVQKRWHSSRGPETHGSMYHRRTGSMGQSADPSHTWKLKHTPGHLGAGRATVQNLTVVKVDKENHLLVLRGSIPGHNNGYVTIRKSSKSARRARKKSMVQKGKAA